MFYLGVAGLLGMGGSALAATQLPARPISGPLPAKVGQASYETVMTNNRNQRVVVGQSDLPGQNFSPQDPYHQPKKTNIRNIRTIVLQSSGKLAPLPGGLPRNAPLTPQQQVVAHVLTRRFSSLQHLNPEDILRQTFPGKHSSVSR
jgi:hypothetical protein